MHSFEFVYKESTSLFVGQTNHDTQKYLLTNSSPLELVQYLHTTIAKLLQNYNFLST